MSVASSSLALGPQHIGTGYTAALIPRGTKSSNPSCSAGSLQNAAKRLDTGKLSSGSEEHQKF